MYLAAVLEHDNAKLPERIAEADRAIAERYRVLNMDHGGSPEKRGELDAAVHALLVLQQEGCRISHSLAGGRSYVFSIDPRDHTVHGV